VIRRFFSRLFGRRRPPAPPRRLPVDGLYEGGPYGIREIDRTEIEAGWHDAFARARDRRRLDRDTWPQSR
jgi:hypothetical protein